MCLCEGAPVLTSQTCLLPDNGSTAQSENGHGDWRPPRVLGPPALGPPALSVFTVWTSPGVSAPVELAAVEAPDDSLLQRRGGNTHEQRVGLTWGHTSGG